MVLFMREQADQIWVVESRQECSIYAVSYLPDQGGLSEHLLEYGAGKTQNISE